MILRLPGGERYEGTAEQCTKFAQQYAAINPTASALDANPAGGHTAEVALDDYLTSESVSGVKPLVQTTYAAMLRAVKIDRLSTTAPENEGAENRFHRAGSERINL